MPENVESVQNAVLELKKKFGSSNITGTEEIKEYATEIEHISKLERVLNEEEVKKLEKINNSIRVQREFLKVASNEFAVRVNLSKEAKKELESIRQTLPKTIEKVRAFQQEMGIRSSLAGISEKDLRIGKDQVKNVKNKLALIQKTAIQQQVLLKGEIEEGNLTKKETKRKLALIKLYGNMQKSAENYTKTIERGGGFFDMRQARKGVEMTMKSATKAESAGGATMGMQITKALKMSGKALTIGMKNVMKDFMKKGLGMMGLAGGIGIAFAGFMQQLKQHILGKVIGAGIWRQFGDATTAGVKTSLDRGGAVFSAHVSEWRGRFLNTAQGIGKDLTTIINEGVINSTKNLSLRFTKVLDISFQFFNNNAKAAGSAMATYKLMGYSLAGLGDRMASLKKMASKLNMPFNVVRQTFTELMGESQLYGTDIKELMKTQGNLFKQLRGKAAVYGYKSYQEIGSAVKNLTELQKQGTLSGRMWMASLSGFKGMAGLGAWQVGNIGKQQIINRTETGAFKFEKATGEATNDRLAMVQKGIFQVVGHLVDSHASQLTQMGQLTMSYENFKQMTGIQSLSWKTFKALLEKPAKGTDEYNATMKELKAAVDNPSQDWKGDLSDALSAGQDVDKQVNVIKEQISSLIGRILLLILNGIIGIPRAILHPTEYGEIMGKQLEGVWDETKALGKMFGKLGGSVYDLFPMLKAGESREQMTERLIKGGATKEEKVRFKLPEYTKNEDLLKQGELILKTKELPEENLKEQLKSIGFGKIPETPKPYASGGIVTEPTLTWIGEGGPEAIIPLTSTGKESPTPVTGARGNSESIGGTIAFNISPTTNAHDIAQQVFNILIEQGYSG